VIIRKAQGPDLAQLIELIKPYQSPQFNWPEPIFSMEFTNTECWVLTVHGKIQSFVCLRDAVAAFELSVLATRQGSFGKGYMSSLILHVQSLYGHQRQLWLEVHEANTTAQKLYEKLGFQMTGRRGGYYQDGSQAFLYTFDALRP
jgi:ribosomal-protein-alanine N-acetyltransferase